MLLIALLAANALSHITFYDITSYYIASHYITSNHDELLLVQIKRVQRLAGCHHIISHCLISHYCPTPYNIIHMNIPAPTSITHSHTHTQTNTHTHTHNMQQTRMQIYNVQDNTFLGSMSAYFSFYLLSQNKNDISPLYCLPLTLLANHSLPSIHTEQTQWYYFENKLGITHE